MRKLVILGLFFISAGSFSQQASSYNSDNYFYYRHYLFLNTPSVLLNAAASKAIAGDTASAIQLIREAAARNMYDTGYITNAERTKFITKTKDWIDVKKIIDANCRRFGNPENMEISTSDIDHFWQIFDRITKPGGDKLVMNEYIMKGSQGLRTFFEVRMGARATSIIETVRTRKKYLESIRPVTLHLYTFKPRMIQAAKKLKDLYPAAIFPPTTFTIGTFSAFGTTDGGSGQLIGSEFLCDTNTVVKDELNDWERIAISDTSRILGILIHELIHIEQQTGGISTLLDKSILEGSADFVTQLVLDYNLNSKLHLYGNTHEKELWNKFKEQMNSENSDQWLYNGANAKDIPADLGYYIGYKICEAYYNKTADKKQAVKDILTIKDFRKFLADSGYGRKF